jgi:hypothetical protein
MHYSKALRRPHKAEPKAREVGPRDDVRESGRMLIDVNWYVFDIRLEPDKGDVRMWRVFRDGLPWIVDGKPLRCGLERVWRLIQAEMAAPLGRRNWIS